MATITVLYPADTKFDLDYYMAKHMPLVLDKWGSMGMSGYTVSKFAATATGDPAPYSIQALLFFSGVEAFQKAASGTPEAQAIMGDIPNFSDKQPIIMIGQDVGKK